MKESVREMKVRTHVFEVCYHVFFFFLAIDIFHRR